MKGVTLLRLIVAVGLFAGVAPDHVFSQQLRLRYGFDEPSGAAVDSSGLAPQADGTLTGGALRTTDTPGSIGLALDLTAPTSHLTTGSDVNKVDALGAFTFTTWLNVQGTPNVFGTGNIMGEPALGSFSGYVSLAYAQPSSGTVSASNFRFQFVVGDGASPGPDRIFSQNVGADHEWVFVAVTFDESRLARIYFGGIDTPVSEIGNGTMSQGLPGNQIPFFLGSPISGTPPPTAMLLDDGPRL